MESLTIGTSRLSRRSLTCRAGSGKHSAHVGSFVCARHSGHFCTAVMRSSYRCCKRLIAVRGANGLRHYDLNRTPKATRVKSAGCL